LGSAAGTRFFAKIFLVDPYPIPPRFATPWDELATPENPQRPVGEQVSAEWNMTRQMHCLAGAKNIPNLIGSSVEDRIIVFEEVCGQRLDSFADSGLGGTRKASSVKTAMFHAGRWLKTVHESSFRGYVSIDLTSIDEALHRLIRIKDIDTTPYAGMTMRAFESACRNLGPQTQLRVPVALNHGDFTLPNLIWNHDVQHLWVVDFELSAYRPILHDLCALIFELRKSLLYPLASQGTVQRWEASFWAGYGPVSDEFIAFANAMATARLFYHTLPKLRTWREERGVWAGAKASLYTHLLEPFLVQRIFSMRSKVNGNGHSISRHSSPAVQSLGGESRFKPLFRIRAGQTQLEHRGTVATTDSMVPVETNRREENVAPSGPTAEIEDVHRLASGVGVVLAGRTAGRLMRLAMDIVLARLLGPLAFGQYAIGWTITRIVTLISPLGLDNGVIRFGSVYRRTDKAAVKGVIYESVLFSLAAGFVLGLAFYLTAPWMGETLFHNTSMTIVFRWFALTFPLISCLRVAAAATQISQRMKFGVYAEQLCQPAVALFLIVLFCLFGWRLKGALVAIVISWGVSLLLGLHYVRRLFPEVVSQEIKSKFLGKELVLFSLPASLSVVCGMILVWVDRLYVGHYRSATEAGTYHAASQLSIGLAVILSAFGAMMSPMTAELFHQQKLKRLEEMFRVSTKWSFYLCLPLFLIMCFVPSQIMTVAFGTPYLFGSSILPILGLAQLLNAGTGTTGSLLVMTGYQNTISLLTAGTMLANIGVEFYLVPRWGMTGAAAGTALSVGGLSIVSVLLIHRFHGIWPYDRRYLKGLLAATMAAFGLWLLRWIPEWSAFSTLALNIVVSLGIFGGSLWLFGLDKEDSEFINLVLSRLACARI
jgi:O-antigen/teichoic acid export membrane protein